MSLMDTERRRKIEDLHNAVVPCETSDGLELMLARNGSRLERPAREV
jgi:hypothetical protein